MPPVINDDMQALIRQLKVNGIWAAIGKEYADGIAAQIAFSGARVYNSANISISTGTSTALTFNSERYDTDSYHDTGSNTSRLTAPATGYYRITGIVRWASNATSYRQIGIQLNGGAFIAFVIGPPASTVCVQIVTCDYQLSAADYVELAVRQDTGGALNVDASANYSPEFMISRL